MKKEMRKLFLEKRNTLPKIRQEEYSRRIQQKIISSQEYQRADWVFVYIDMGSEVKTVPLIEQAWKDKKRVAVPIAVPLAQATRLMYFVEIFSFEGMQRTKLGVMEPNIPIDKQVFPTPNSLFLVPGSMFDINKNRCGYGGGYYDTYTRKHNVANTIGICYDLQVTHCIPTGKYDRKLSKIITEQRVIL